MNPAYCFQMFKCSIVAVIEHIPETRCPENKLCNSILKHFGNARFVQPTQFQKAKLRCSRLCRRVFYADSCGNSFWPGDVKGRDLGRDYFQGRMACASLIQIRSRGLQQLIDSPVRLGFARLVASQATSPIPQRHVIRAGQRHVSKCSHSSQQRESLCCLWQG